MDYVIETQFGENPFTMVPNHVLTDRRLKPEDIGVLAFMAMHHDGWILRRSVVCERFGFGKDRWLSISRRLRAVGALRLVTGRSECGRHIVTSYLIGWPQPVEHVEKRGGGKPVSTKKRGGGKPVQQGGKPAQGRAENPPPYKDNTTADARPPKGQAASAVKNEVSKTDLELSDLWRRAAFSASQGMRWRNPESGEWFDSWEKPDGGFPVDS